MMGFLADLLGTRSRGMTPLKEAGSFSATGVSTACVGGTTSTPGRTTLVTQTLAMGTSAKLLTFFAHVTDQGGADQIYFQLCRNGFPLSGYERIPGVQFENQGTLTVNENVRGGEISIRAVNISGVSITIEPDAIDIATTIKCQAGFTGQLMSERGGV